jgi:hypothetical protein
VRPNIPRCMYARPRQESSNSDLHDVRFRAGANVARNRFPNDAGQKWKHIETCWEVEMKRSDVSRLCAAFIAITMPASKPAMAAHICWIDRVISAPNGITLKFRPDASLFGGIKYKNKQEIVHFFVENGSAKIGGENEKPLSGTEVVLNVGDSMGIHQGVEDTCDVQVVVQGARAGVLLHGVTTASAYGPSSSSEFVPAE